MLAAALGSLALAALAGRVCAAPLSSSVVVERAAAANNDPFWCNPYTIITTRGSGENQGVSSAFASMVNTVVADVTSKSTVYNTKYPASIIQDPKPATADMLKQIQDTRSYGCNHTRFVLLGYSQGAQATVDLLRQLPPTSEYGSMITAVLLFGNPVHWPNLASNVDANGKKTTASLMGWMSGQGQLGLTKVWDKTGKVMDLCAKGDTVCGGNGWSQQHLQYNTNTAAQATGLKFVLARLKAAGFKLA